MPVIVPLQPLADLEALPRRVLCLAARPGEEGLCCGGLLAFHALRGDDVRVLVVTGGEDGEAAGREARLGANAETAREIACRLCATCEREKHVPEALAWIALVRGLPEITLLACEGSGATAMHGRPPWERQRRGC